MNTTQAVRISATMLLALVASAAEAVPSISLVPDAQMRIDLPNSSVTANGAAWDVDLYMANDNYVADGVLPAGFRRWWHVEIGDLNPAGETLNITVSHEDYTDFITPVWSTDGGATYERITGVVDNFDFTVATPPGTTSIRVAKWFPYTIADHDAYLATIETDPRVVRTDIGNTVLGRDVLMHTITDPGAPSTGKKRVWLHSAVHCAENTAYFTTEGMIDWLLSGDPRADAVLEGAIFNVVLMANPDGVANGNYRTNANSVNLELEWGAPYNSTQPEIVAMRTQIEGFMGTAGSPGSNPIELLLNLHATHNVSLPFHFVHAANWPTNGVTASVNALELDWVREFRACSVYLNRGSNQSSTLGSRPYVESMMHDRYSIQPQWNDIVAITMEGTYESSPVPGVSNTPDDYRAMGAGMAMAVGHHFGILPIPGESDTIGGGILINEILVDPAGALNFDTDGDGTASSADEFVEVANVSASPIDIGGWQVWSDSDNLWFTFPGGTIVPGGAKALVISDVGAGGSVPAMDAGSVAFDANDASGFLIDGGDNVVLRSPSTGEYVQLRYAGDSPTLALNYSSFPGASTLAGCNEDWGTPAEGLSLSRMPDGDMIVDGDPRDNTALGVQATPGRRNDSPLPVAVDAFLID